MASKTYTHQGRPDYLNKLAPRLFPVLASKAKAMKAIAKGELMINGKQVKYDARVMAGDEITFHGIQKAAAPKRKLFHLKVEVLFEDGHIAAVHKPGGIPVNGVQLKTLENALPHNLKASQESDALAYPMPLHRLDTPTTGIVLIAKTNRAQVKMGRLFQNKEIQKRYKAVVVGELPSSAGEVVDSIDGKPAKTRYEVLRVSPSVQYGKLSMVALFPITGRTHQLRIHMTNLGCPIVGDKQYSGHVEVLIGKGLMLCSDQVSFQHPITGKSMTVETEIPNKFIRYMDREDRGPR